MELFRHELYKVFCRKTVWIGLLFVIILVCFSSYMQASQLTNTYGNMREYYNNLYKGKEGSVSDSLKQAAKSWIEKNGENYQAKFITNQTSVQENREYGFYSQVLNPDYLTKNTQDEIAKLKNDTKTANSSYNVSKDNSQIKILQNLQAPGLYFTLSLLNDLDFPEGLGFVVMGILVLLGISPVFSDEYSSNADSLILSSKKGRRSVVTAKILSTTVYCVFVAAIVLLMYSSVQAAVLGIQGLNAPLQLGFINSPYSLTFGGYLALQGSLCAVACVFFGMLVLLVSSVSSNVLIPFFICGFLFASTAFIKSIGTAVPQALITFSDFSYTELMRVKGLVESFKAYDILGHPVLYLNLILISYFMITAVLIFLTYRIFHCRQVK
jgi:hypothetical protein